MSKESPGSFKSGSIGRRGRRRPKSTPVDHALGPVGIDQTPNRRPDVPMRIRTSIWNRRKLDAGVRKAGPANDDLMFIRRPLERTSQVVNDHVGLPEFPNQRLERRGVSGLKMKLDRKA